MVLIRKLILHPSFGSMLLFFSSIVAILMKNSNLCFFYEKIVYFPILFYSKNIEFFSLDLVNEVIMTIFFLYIGLETKYKLLRESVNKFSYLGFSIISAIGGMLFPAILYFIITYKYPNLRSGWAISTTTDIAFSLSILSTIKDIFKSDLKIFLMLLASIDDILSILIIAIFYTKKLNFLYLFISFLIGITLIIINYFNIQTYILYFLFGTILWIFLFLSGIHATLSGVITGIMIPNHSSNSSDSIIKKLLKQINPYVKYIILPLFGFFNSGITIKSNYHCFCLILPISIVLSLVLGKSIGITVFSYISMKLKIFRLSNNMNNITNIFSISIICGIGFTMSIFIANIAFKKFNEDLVDLSKVGILIGSSISAILGYILLNRLSIKKRLN